MKNTRPVAPRQLMWSSEVRAQFPNPSIMPARNVVGFLFDPVPRGLDDLIRDGVLIPIDELVLKRLLRFRQRLKASCWTSKAVLAEPLGVSAKTIQRSFSRLAAVGLIESISVPSPDPDEPENRTGRRIVFPWLTPAGRNKGDGIGVDAAVLGVGTPVSRGGRTAVAPNESDGIQLETSSSLEARTDDDEVSLTSIKEPERSEPSADGLAVVAAIQVNLGTTIAAQVTPHVEALVELVNHDTEALTVATVKAGTAVRRKPIGDVLRYALMIVLADVLGLPVDQAVAAVNRFSKGKRLLPIDSETCRRDLDAARGRGAPFHQNFNPPRKPEPPPASTEADIASLEALIANPACHRALRAKAERDLATLRNLVPATSCPAQS